MVRTSISRSPLRLGFLLIPLALAVSLAITARANGPHDLISSSAARSHGNAAVQQPASPLIKALPTHPLWSDDTIIYDNGGPNQQDGNEMTEWIQAEDFNLSADSTLMIVNFWDIEAPGGAAYQGEIDWTLYADAGGMPGAAFASGAAVGGDVTRTFIQGGVLDFFDEYSNSFNISPGVALTAGTTYWLGLHNGPLTFTTLSEFYWETTDFNGTFTGHEDQAPFDGFWFDNHMEHAFNLEGTTGGGGPTLVSAASRMTHGSAGDFDIDMPLTGPSGVEDRQELADGGGERRTFLAIFTFDTPVTSGDVSVTGGVAFVQFLFFSGNEIQVFLSGVPSAQVVTLTVSNVNGLGGSADVDFGFLVGDVNGNRIVDKADADQIVADKNQAVNGSNFRDDINSNGVIGGHDFNYVNAHRNKHL